MATEKDWEDIKKMPEHPTLSKDFKKGKLVDFLVFYACPGKGMP